jgi:hypothetical protein
LAGNNDHGQLRQGCLLYNTPVAWIRFATEERHN